MIENAFFLFIFGTVVSAVFTVPTIRLAKHFHLIDDPKKHKHPAVIHTKPVPRAGGLPIYLALLFGIIVFFPKQTFFPPLLFAGFLVVITGLLDDKFDLSPYIRFLMNIICAAIVVFSGANIPFITNPFGGILLFSPLGISFFIFHFLLPLPQIFAIFWIVWIMNMLNWSKGVDGQMPGIAVISAIVIGVASLRFPVLSQSDIIASQLAFLVAGAALGFLIFNFYPAKIFPGYSATILGFMIGFLAIVSGVKLATAILVMGVPVSDALITILRRIFSKKSPFWHDKGHLHHLLLSAGFSQRGIAFFYWFMSALLGLIALNLSSRGKLFAIILVVVLVSGVILTLRLFLKKEDQHV